MCVSQLWLCDVCVLLCDVEWFVCFVCLCLWGLGVYCACVVVVCGVLNVFVCVICCVVVYGAGVCVCV